MDEWTWINPNCNSIKSDWYERKFMDMPVVHTKHFTRTFRVHETFPVEEHERWSVKERNRLVEDWTVISVSPKKTSFTVSIYQDQLD